MRILKIKGYDVLLDDEDYLRLCYPYKWQVKTSPQDGRIYFYIKKTINKKRYTIYLHRAIMSPPLGLDLSTDTEVHHKKGTLDCRKESMEIRTKSEHNKLKRKI